MREKKLEQAGVKSREQLEYEQVKEEFRQRAAADVSEGKVKPIDQILRSERLRKLEARAKTAASADTVDGAAPLAAPAAEARGRGETAGSRAAVERPATTSAALPAAALQPVRLSQSDAAEIDALFAGFEQRDSSKGPPSSGAGSGAAAAPAVVGGVGALEAKRRRFAQAKKLIAEGALSVGDVPAGTGDRRTWRQRELDQEDVEEKQVAEQHALAHLRQLQLTRKGEPTRFEQAAGEVYCWWPMPPGIVGKDVRVECTEGGARLAVSVRGVEIFRQKLFQRIKMDDIVWSVEDRDLHLTLTKFEREVLWEQLGEVPEIQYDEHGEMIPETVPEPMSAGERLHMFRQMTTGDDGVVADFESMSRSEQRFVLATRKYHHARATGDKKEQAEAEAELEEFGRITI